MTVAQAVWPKLARGKESSVPAAAEIPLFHDELGIDAGFLNACVQRGVPFHMVENGTQDERPRADTVSSRMAAGATLFLVQPHEYMPRLRRWIFAAGKELGFRGRPCRSFLFRVDVGGREAMPLHDDGPSDLLWLQLQGERYALVGEPAHPRDAAVLARSIAEADGTQGGWFEGPLPPGSVLYLPPFAPHKVQCRRPSVALSVYWEPGSVNPEAKDEDERMAVSMHDGAGDRPPRAEDEAWERPETSCTAWRAFGLVARREQCVLVAEDAVLSFPGDALGPLSLLAEYGSVRRSRLDEVRGALSAAGLTRLLCILHEEGLLHAGRLPIMGEFELDELTGWEYEAGSE